MSNHNSNDEDGEGTVAFNESRQKPSPELSAAPSFTPGPWKTWMQAGPLVAATPGGKRVYSASASMYDKIDHEANACLIAAAPVLYHAASAALPMLILAAHEAGKINDVEAAGRYIDTATALQDAIALATKPDTNADASSGTA